MTDLERAIEHIKARADALDYVSIKEVNEAFDLADIELSKESKTFKD